MSEFISPLAQISPGALIDRDVRVGEGSAVWNAVHVREGAVVGAHCVVGEGAYIGAGVTVGDRSKIQNSALLYEPAVVADGVFVGPGVVFTNDRNPRAVVPSGAPKASSDWEAVGVTVDTGASIGARAVCVAPVRIGRWVTVAAGAVVTRDVPPFALVAGVPARQIGWVGRAGHRLIEIDGVWLCPETGERYHLAGAIMTEARA